ncbi:hypothetical protein MBLNU230_g5270t1 [Neophaeotheca triangularis]
MPDTRWIPPPPLPEFYADARPTTAPENNLPKATRPTPRTVPTTTPQQHLGTVHICRICLKPRSRTYHLDHPIPVNGIPPPPGICSRCRVTDEKVFTTSEVKVLEESGPISIGVRAFVPLEGQVDARDVEVRGTRRALRVEHRVPQAALGFGLADERIARARNAPEEIPMAAKSRRSKKIEAITVEGTTWRAPTIKPERPSKSLSEDRYPGKESASFSSGEGEPAIAATAPSYKVRVVKGATTDNERLQEPRRKDIVASSRLDHARPLERTESDIRRIAREEVERYRQAERAMESHPTTYAHGRLVPVEREATEPTRRSRTVSEEVQRLEARRRKDDNEKARKVSAEKPPISRQDRVYNAFEPPRSRPHPGASDESPQEPLRQEVVFRADGGYKVIVTERVRHSLPEIARHHSVVDDRESSRYHRAQREREETAEIRKRTVENATTLERETPERRTPRSQEQPSPRSVYPERYRTWRAEDAYQVPPPPAAASTTNPRRRPSPSETDRLYMLSGGGPAPSRHEHSRTPRAADSDQEYEYVRRTVAPVERSTYRLADGQDAEVEWTYEETERYSKPPGQSRKTVHAGEEDFVPPVRVLSPADSASRFRSKDVGVCDERSRGPGAPVSLQAVVGSEGDESARKVLDWQRRAEEPVQRPVRMRDRVERNERAAPEARVSHGNDHCERRTEKPRGYRRTYVEERRPRYDEDDSLNSTVRDSRSRDEGTLNQSDRYEYLAAPEPRGPTSHRSQTREGTRKHNTTSERHSTRHQTSQHMAPAAQTSAQEPVRPSSPSTYKVPEKYVKLTSILKTHHYPLYDLVVPTAPEPPPTADHRPSDSRLLAIRRVSFSSQVDISDPPSWAPRGAPETASELARARERFRRPFDLASVDTNQDVISECERRRVVALPPSVAGSSRRNGGESVRTIVDAEEWAQERKPVDQASRTGSAATVRTAASARGKPAGSDKTIHPNALDANDLDDVRPLHRALSESPARELGTWGEADMDRDVERLLHEGGREVRGEGSSRSAVRSQREGGRGSSLAREASGHGSGRGSRRSGDREQSWDEGGGRGGGDDRGGSGGADGWELRESSSHRGSGWEGSRHSGGDGAHRARSGGR